MTDVPLVTGDIYKDEVQRQWDRDPCGSQYGEDAPQGTLDWFLNIEKHRYGVYAPWMPRLMEFNRYRGKKVIEIGGGLGTDLCQFAQHGALVTDFDLSAGHLELARRNFAARRLAAEFHHGDAENMPFTDNAFDVVYSNGVIHHTPNTQKVLSEMFRILRPGGRVIVMVYAENSLHYWRNIVGLLGLRQRQLETNSIGDIMSRTVELSEHGSKPLVKVYTRRRVRAMFSCFENVRIYQRQMVPEERPRLLSWVPVQPLQRLCGWNLIVKGNKPL